MLLKASQLDVFLEATAIGAGSQIDRPADHKPDRVQQRQGQERQQAEEENKHAGRASCSYCKRLCRFFSRGVK